MRVGMFCAVLQKSPMTLSTRIAPTRRPICFGLTVFFDGLKRQCLAHPAAAREGLARKCFVCPFKNERNRREGMLANLVQQFLCASTICRVCGCKGFGRAIHRPWQNQALCVVTSAPGAAGRAATIHLHTFFVRCYEHVNLKLGCTLGAFSRQRVTWQLALVRTLELVKIVSEVVVTCHASKLLVAP